MVDDESFDKPLHMSLIDKGLLTWKLFRVFNDMKTAQNLPCRLQYSSYQRVSLQYQGTLYPSTADSNYTSKYLSTADNSSKTEIKSSSKSNHRGVYF